MSKRIIFIYTNDLTKKQVDAFHKYGLTLMFDNTLSVPLQSLHFDYLLVDGRILNNLVYLLKLPATEVYQHHLILYSDQYIDTVPLFMTNIIYFFPKEKSTKFEFDYQLLQPYVKYQQKKRMYELEKKGLSFEPFETDMKVDKNRRIIALSDVHGDIDALIVCLRDCAGVIKKKAGHEFDPIIERDPELATMLSQDINDIEYVRDLHYEWCGDETIVVIIGDLIDPARGTTVDPITQRESLYYPQVELKLLHFINSLNEHSLEYAHEKHLSSYGRIIKLIGNHELINFRHYSSSDRDWIKNYLLTLDKDHPHYFNGQSRDTIFRFGEYGFKLYQETTGTGVLVKINQNIFVHGELGDNIAGITLRSVSDFNRALNQSTLTLVETKNRPFMDQMILILAHLLEGREYGSPQGGAFGKIIVADRIDKPVQQAAFCVKVKTNINYFCNGECGLDPEHVIRIFKGHCQQNNFTPAVVRNSLGTIVDQTPLLDILSNVTMIRAHHNGEPNRSFGITGECDLISSMEHGEYTYQPQVIKLDVAMGRGQLETPAFYQDIIKRLPSFNERILFMSKTPQVIEISNHRLLILRCSLENMVRHLPRPQYKEMEHQAAVILEPLIQDIVSGLLTDKELIAHTDRLLMDGSIPVFVKQIIYRLHQLIHKSNQEAVDYATLFLSPSIYEGKVNRNRNKNRKRYSVRKRNLKKKNSPSR